MTAQASPSANGSAPTARVLRQESATDGALAALAGQRVLFISEATAFGGHESMALRAATALSKAGVEVAFRCWRGNERLLQGIARANEQGAAISIDDGAAADVRLGSLRWWTRSADIAAARGFLAADRSFARVLVQGRIDSGLVTLQAAHDLDVRLISYIPMAHTLRQMGTRAMPQLRERVLRRHYAIVPAFIAIDAAVAADLERRGACGPIAVVENWIPAPARAAGDEAAGRLAARSALGLPANARIVATVGRVEFRQKGHPHLLAALASAAGRRLDLHWLVVGDGPDLQALRRDVVAAGLGGRCHFTTWLDGGMEQVYSATDVVALPSNYEGVPLVMMEALARGLPVVGSNIDGMAGWLPLAARFERSDTRSVVQSLSSALDPAQRQAYGTAFERARLATVPEHFARAWGTALRQLAGVSSP